MSVSREIRGMLLVPKSDEHGWVLIQDGVMAWDERGALIKVEAASADCEVAVTRPGAVWMPGFVDTHIHFPQTRIVGSASGPLLPWLQRSVFPEEGRFAQVDYARQVAEQFCERMLSQGTTCASIFSSSHPQAADVLFDVMQRRGLRGDVGLTLMDRGAPDGLLRGPEEAMAASEELVERWHGVDNHRLRFCVTPRFALSCTPQLLKAAGEFADRHKLPIQTHISENPDEIKATAEAFPKARDYLGVYEDFGLVGERSLFAHGVWLTEREWDSIAAHDAAISHCPDSNFFLASGPMPLKEAKTRRVKLGLGTDVGAGRSFSLRRCCSRAYDASRLTESSTDAGELLWFATRGGAVAMGRGEQVGLLEPGFDADVIAIELPPVGDTLEGVAALCERLVFYEDWDGVAQVYIRGRLCWSRDEADA